MIMIIILNISITIIIIHSSIVSWTAGEVAVTPGQILTSGSLSRGDKENFQTRPWWSLVVREMAMSLWEPPAPPGRTGKLASAVAGKRSWWASGWTPSSPPSPPPSHLPPSFSMLERRLLMPGAKRASPTAGASSWWLILIKIQSNWPPFMLVKAQGQMIGFGARCLLLIVRSQEVLTGSA